MSAYHTDDLGLSSEFTDPNNFDAFDNDLVKPRGDKSCVCGHEVVRFDVYRYEADCCCEGPNETEPTGWYCGHNEAQTAGGIVGVRADGSTCCSAFEDLGEAESIELAAEFNARERVHLSQEL